MSKLIKYSGKREATKERLPVPTLEAGTYAAVLIGLFDIGYHLNPKFEKKQRRVVGIFEVDKTIALDAKLKTADNAERFDLYNGKRYVISFEETLSLNSKANLRKYLNTWLGGLDVDDDQFIDYDSTFELLQKELVGKSALVSIATGVSQATGKEFAKITGIMQLPKGTKELVAENTDFKAPGWVQKKIDAQVDSPNVVQKEI